MEIFRTATEGSSRDSARSSNGLWLLCEGVDNLVRRRASSPAALRNVAMSRCHCSSSKRGFALSMTLVASSGLLTRGALRSFVSFFLRLLTVARFILAIGHVIPRVRAWNSAQSAPYLLQHRSS